MNLITQSPLSPYIIAEETQQVKRMLKERQISQNLVTDA